MSDYGRIVTTNQGKNMVTESIRTKSAIIFTKISLGDGLLNGETIETMTGLKHRLLDGNIPKINPLGNGEIEAVSTVSNSELTAGFFARELGLFAKLGEEGEEQLFAYTNAGSNASYIPPNTSVDEKMLGIQLGIGDATVQINYQSHLYITYEQLEDGITHHNSDENAHNNRFKAIIQQLNNMITSVDNAEGQTKAPTLALVKDLQKAYLPLTGGDLKGEITVNGKATKSIVDSWYNNDKSQYWIKYSDGELVQMLSKDNPDGTGIIFTTINLFQPFVDTNYFVNAVYETHGRRQPNQNTSLSNSITAIDNTVVSNNSVPKSKNKFTISIDSMSLCRVYCVGRWKE